jgi:hypothetical protein
MSGSLRPVALSIRNADMQADRIFELKPDGPIDQAPYTPWRMVRELGQAVGLHLMTADQVIARGIDPREVTVISYDWPPTTDVLVASGARLGVLTSLEPPVIAWQLYYHLREISGRFPHTLLFEGGRARTAATTRFQPLYFPQVRQPLPLSWRDWQRRRLLVSINSNKAIVRSFTRWFDRPREVSIKREVASRRYPPIAADLYLERLRVAAQFADRPDFDIFGHGWSRRHPAVPLHLHQAILRAYRGPVQEKLETLSRYRLSLCLENSAFDGYVSEKIFDCFFTRTIPIYLGAPDIERYVPAEAFIDLRKFRTYRDLELFLDGLDEVSLRRYLEAADDYVNSSAYQPFTADCFAQLMVGLVAEVAGAK